VSLQRPFFPQSSHGRGMARREQLSQALGLAWPQLYRRCERRTATRRPACPLFWTLGANQVGKASIAGWQEVVRPMAERVGDVGLWPFDGPLNRLLGTRPWVLAESYPAEFYSRLGLPGRPGKRSASARRRLGANLLPTVGRLGARLSMRAAAAVEDGFGAGAGGEDYFDAMVGLLGILKHLQAGGRPEEPDDDDVRTVEGWILGQAPDEAPPRLDSAPGPAA
jgi:hypothetical protein